MATPYRDILPEVRTHLSGAPDRTCLLYLRRAGQQFCQDSRIWDVDIGHSRVAPLTDSYASHMIPVPSTEDPRDYSLPADSYLNKISTVWLNDRKNDPIDSAYIEYDVAERLLIIDQRAICETADLHVAAILQPTKSAQQIPDFIAELYSEAIADYAIFEMMMMPNKDWSDRNLAGAFRTKYQNRVSEATVAKARKGVRKRITLAPPDFV